MEAWWRRRVERLTQTECGLVIAARNDVLAYLRSTGFISPKQLKRARRQHPSVAMTCWELGR